MTWTEGFEVGHGVTQWDWDPAPGWFATIRTRPAGGDQWADYILTGPDDLRIEGEAADVDKAKVVVGKIYEALR